MVASVHSCQDDRIADPPPRLSVILPTYNRPQLLREALCSLEAQSFHDWEAIIVDDAAFLSGETLRIAAQYHRAKVITHESSRGGAAAKNTGIHAARGRFLAFLDDDDLYDPAYLTRAIEVFDRHRDIEVLFMGVTWFGKDALQSARAHSLSLKQTLAHAPGEFIEPHLVRWSGLSLLDALLHRVPMPFQRVVVRSSVFNVIGAYRTNCLLWDCEWALRASMRMRCALLNEPLYRQRSDGQGIFSRADHEHHQIESAAEMIMNLYRHISTSDPVEARALLRHGANRNMHALAYYLSTHGDLAGALRVWWHAQLIKPSLSGIRFPIAAIVRALQATVR
jgi:glycosyltransferase involved in cell wall biosynthesis